MDISEIDNIKMFFILGRPRSGTTLLRTLFDAHTNVSIPYEGRIIMDLYFKYAKVKTWTGAKLLSFYNDVISSNKVDAWDFKDTFKDDILSLGNNANYTRLIKLVYLNFDSLFTKDNIILIGDKNPYYSIRKSYLKIIKKVFPDAKIVHLVRDCRAHYSSMINMNFENNSVGMVSYRWKYSYNIIRNEFYGTDNYLFVKHEDVTANPKNELTRICNFLGLEFQDNMLEYYKIKDIVIEEYGEELLKIHSSLFNPITDKFNDKWKTNLDDNIVKKIEAIIGNLSEELAYERKFKNSGVKINSLFYKLYNSAYFFYAYLIDYAPLNLKRRILKAPSLRKLFIKP